MCALTCKAEIAVNPTLKRRQTKSRHRPRLATRTEWIGHLMNAAGATTKRLFSVSLRFRNARIGEPEKGTGRSRKNGSSRYLDRRPHASSSKRISHASHDHACTPITNFLSRASVGRNQPSGHPVCVRVAARFVSPRDGAPPLISQPNPRAA